MYGILINPEILNSSFLIPQGADINLNQHGADYTPLHFAALSGNAHVCRQLLDAGIRPGAINSVQRTAAQMAAFVGNFACVETINNYVTRSSLEYYTQLHGQQTEPQIPPSLLQSFHAFVTEINLHPVRIALNVQSLGLLRILGSLRKTLALMCEKEMQKSHDANELLAFKFHYQGWILAELIRCEEQFKAQHKETGEANKSDFLEMFVKRVLKENKLGQLDYVEYTLRECAREFPVRECTIFRQIALQLGSKDAPPALTILRNAINGMRGFVVGFCRTPTKYKITTLIMYFPSRTRPATAAPAAPRSRTKSVPNAKRCSIVTASASAFTGLCTRRAAPACWPSRRLRTWPRPRDPSTPPSCARSWPS